MAANLLLLTSGAPDNLLLTDGSNLLLASTVLGDQQPVSFYNAVIDQDYNTVLDLDLDGDSFVLYYSVELDLAYEAFVALTYKAVIE